MYSAAAHSKMEMGHWDRAQGVPVVQVSCMSKLPDPMTPTMIIPVLPSKFTSVCGLMGAAKEVGKSLNLAHCSGLIDSKRM